MARSGFQPAPPLDGTDWRAIAQAIDQTGAAAFQRADHLTQPDLIRWPGQHRAPAPAAPRHQNTALHKALHDLGQR